MAELYCGLRGGMISLYDIHNQNSVFEWSEMSEQWTVNSGQLKLLKLTTGH